jgi:NAD(P)H-dependent FMN reductase
VLAVATRAAAHEGNVDDFGGLATIPAFNPEHDDPAPAPVTAWRARLAAADAVLIATPEYAGSLPGALKNALDWIVGSAELYTKPVAVVSAGPGGGALARTDLVRTLTWQGAHVVAQLGIAAVRNKIDAEGRLADPATVADIEALTRVVLDAPVMDAARRIALVTSVVEPLGIDPRHVAPLGG